MSGKKLSLAGKVCLVTGATRGIGKGIALQLGEAGATVYITGRTLKKGPNDKGSLEMTAAEIQERGGRCIPVLCDHTKDEDIHKLFERVKTEQNGQLDVLVNNAYSAVTAIQKSVGVPFWEQPLALWDECNNVGLRNHYLCTVLAARLMVPRQNGLIVFISSAGGLRYLFNVAYGVGKEACDRMAVDCAFELRKQNIAVVSLWPGLVRTEAVMDVVNRPEESTAPKHNAYDFLVKAVNSAESIEYAGKSIVHLASDANIMSKSGRILLTADLGSEYSFVDTDGKRPDNIRSLSYLLTRNKSRFSWIASFLPDWIKVPFWVMHFGGYKF